MLILETTEAQKYLVILSNTKVVRETPYVL